MVPASSHSLSCYVVESAEGSENVEDLHRPCCGLCVDGICNKKKIIYSILCQHINCDADRENGYKYFQPLNRNFSCKPASKPYANSVSQNDQHQKSQDFCPGNSGKIADTCRNGNKTQNQKSATPTAILADTPHATRRGITSTGPPAPEREQIAPVVIPRKIRNPIWSAIDLDGKD